MKPQQRAFTMVEFMITVALVAVVASLAGPSMYRMVQMQRLRGINANLVTDMQYARSEAVARGKNVWVQFKVDSSSLTCYTIYTDQSNGSTGAGNCDCTRTDLATRCTASAQELKTVQLPASDSVKLAIDTASAYPAAFAFDPITGGIYVPPTDVASTSRMLPMIDTQIDSGRLLRMRIAQTGRPVVCVPSGSVVTGGYPSC